MASCWATSELGVVAARLGRAHAAAAGAGVVLAQPDRDRREALGEVGAGGRGDHHVGDVLGGPHPEEGLGGEHERPHVEALLARRLRHPALVGADQGVDGGHEVLDREHRQRQPLRGADHPGRVLLRAEGPDRAVRVAVGLHALEDLLRVVQDGGRGVQRERGVRRDAGVVPALLGGPLGDEHVVGEVPAEAGGREDLGEPVRVHRVVGRGDLDLQRAVHGVHGTETSG